MAEEMLKNILNTLKLMKNEISRCTCFWTILIVYVDREDARILAEIAKNQLDNILIYLNRCLELLEQKEVDSDG